jgi:glycosyltransferase involved in cell wall biosynthesis
MKIVYLASVRIPTEKASGLAIMRQCEAFASLHHELTLVRPDRKNSITDDAFSYYVINEIFSVKKVRVFQLYDALGIVGYILMRISLLFALSWYVYINRKHIDILYARDPWVLCIPLLFFSRKKIVFEVHTKHTNFVTRFVVARVGLLVAISEGLRQFYAPVRKDTKTVVEPSGVDIEQFENLPTVRETRTQLSLPENTTLCGYIGKYKTMGEAKGVDEIIETFAAVHKEVQNTHLLLVGLEQDEWSVVQEKCNACNLEANAYTLRALYPKDFARYVHACDVLLMHYPIRNTTGYTCPLRNCLPILQVVR